MIFSATFPGKDVKSSMNPVKFLPSIKKNISDAETHTILPKSVK